MILETDGYVELIQYLTEHLSIFTEPVPTAEQAEETVRECFEAQLANSIILVNQQHEIDTATRLEIVREADGILYDLEEVLASVLDTRPGQQQQAFIKEFVGLVKNLFDCELSKQGL